MIGEEEKQLLLIDLCARLPYGVICKLSAKSADVSITEKLDIGGLEHFIFSTMDVLPYLRPMSSMTAEEKEELYQKTGFRADDYILGLSAIDWLNAHHFDYRDLIKKELALEAPEEMYK